MTYLIAFIIGLVFSFVGSIPPGTLNLCVLQLGLEHKVATALRFALAVSLIEYPYAWVAVVFEDWLTSSPAIIRNFQLITATVMLVLGIFTLIAAQKPTSFAQRFNASGFRRGILLSILNPMAIPFWVGVTAYLKAQGWITLSTPGHVHSYVAGTSVGAMVLLTLFALMARRLSGYVTQSKWVKLAPGVTLVALGIYALLGYLF
jgi:threonine/homoserine/homoserine lactone efflux protein